jgi:hypothetical protein
MGTSEQVAEIVQAVHIQAVAEVVEGVGKHCIVVEPEEEADQAMWKRHTGLLASRLMQCMRSCCY